MNHRKQRGAVLVLVMIGMVALLAMVGLAIDMGHLGLNKSRLQSTVDAAALAAAKVLDQGGDQGQATEAAMNVFGLNSQEHPELDNVMNDGLNIVVQYSNTVNPFAAGTAPANYVRVAATDFSMWAGLTSLVGVDNMSTAACAVAGPSPTINNACNIAPMLVCGDPAAAPPYYGYEPDVLSVLKLASGSNPTSPVGPGNFQLIRLGGAGGQLVRQNMAGSYTGCLEDDEMVETQTGNLTGPVTQGLNTRFGEYQGGGVSAEDYPPDVITTGPSPTLDYDDTTKVITQGGQAVTQGSEIDFNYQEYLSRLSSENYDNAPAPNGIGVPLRREMTIPIVDCTGTNTGNSHLPVLGFGCYFLLQPAVQKGNDNYVYGQFVQECQTGGVPGPDPNNAPGPHIIQLYNDTGSADS
jgi:Flp pilus assembly protein TadG